MTFVWQEDLDVGSSLVAFLEDIKGDGNEVFWFWKLGLVMGLMRMLCIYSQFYVQGS